MNGYKLANELYKWAEFNGIHPDDFQYMWGQELLSKLKKTGNTELSDDIMEYIVREDPAYKDAYGGLFAYEICNVLERREK